MKVEDNQYLGPIKYRGRFFLKLEKRLNFNAFTIHVMVDRAGRKSTFYNIKNENNVSINEGDCIAVTATVAKYKLYKNVPQTYLNRVVLIENKGNASVV
jgi:hypothetical protein|tara:strand:- start:210 stop:506 length:297 start_codon:yes stop_codon:yes gene_type:complete